MKKYEIVKEHTDFDDIIAKGKYRKNNFFVIYNKESNFSYPRFGIAVGKKIGNAVNRNKYKRKLRAIIDNYKKLYVNNQDYIIILRGIAKEKEYKELENEFLQLMDNIRKDIKLHEEKK